VAAAIAPIITNRDLVPFSTWSRFQFLHTAEVADVAETATADPGRNRRQVILAVFVALVFISPDHDLLARISQAADDGAAGRRW
jgi:hypothetical protein